MVREQKGACGRHTTAWKLLKFDRWDKNPPARDCPYGIFGKRMQRSILGFGSLATAIYSRELISEAALHASHGSTPSKGEMRHFQQRLVYHQYVGVPHQRNLINECCSLGKMIPRSIEPCAGRSKPCFVDFQTSSATSPKPSKTLNRSLKKSERYVTVTSPHMYAHTTICTYMCTSAGDCMCNYMRKLYYQCYKLTNFRL